MKNIFTSSIICSLAVWFFHIGGAFAIEGDSAQVSFTVAKINDNAVVRCALHPVEVAIVVDDWTPGIQYLWSNGSTDSVTNIHATLINTYYVTVTQPLTGQSVIETFSVNLDYTPLDVTAHGAVIPNDVCPGSEATLSVDVANGLDSYWIKWSSGGNGLTEKVSPIHTQEYEVRVSDACGVDTIRETVTVEVPKFEPLEITGLDDKSLLCPGMNLTMAVDESNAKGGFGSGYVFSWDDWQSTEKFIAERPETHKEYSLQMTDACGIDTVTKKIMVTITSLDVDFEEHVSICKGQSVQLQAGIENMDGVYTFVFEGASHHAPLTVRPKESVVYELGYRDICSAERVKYVFAQVNAPSADFEYDLQADRGDLIQFTNASSNTVKWNWYFGDGETSSDEHPIHVFSSKKSFPVTLIATDEFGCVDKHRELIKFPEDIFAPTAFTPNNDGVNDVFKTYTTLGLKKFRIDVYDRWGTLIFSSDDPDFEWDGSTFKGKASMGTYAYKLKATTFQGSTIDKFGYLTVVME